MKTVLLTGVTGFLGSYVAREILDEYHVVGLKRGSSDIFRIQDISAAMTLYNVDEISLKSVFDRHSVHAVIHTATDYGKGRTSDEVTQSNLDYPLELLSLAADNGVKAFVNSDTFYTAKYGVLEEYVRTKKMFLEAARTRKANVDKFINLQIGIIFGPSDHRDKFTSSIIQKLIVDTPNVDLTEGQQKRDFLFIKQAAQIYKLIIDKLDQIDESFVEYSIGSGRATSIREYVEIIHRITGSSSSLSFGAIPYRDNEIMDPGGSIEGIRRLGWDSNATLEEGLLETVEYEKSLTGN